MAARLHRSQSPEAVPGYPAHKQITTAHRYVSRSVLRDLCIVRQALRSLSSAAQANARPFRGPHNTPLTLSPRSSPLLGHAPRDNIYKLGDDGHRRTLEEFWYDALGRRVLVRANRSCSDVFSSRLPGLVEDCGVGRVRRTVWDGDHELYEMQVPIGPTASREDDVGPTK